MQETEATGGDDTVDPCPHVHFGEVDTQWTLDSAAQDLVAADLDGDGLLDFVVTRDARQVVVLRNRGEKGRDGKMFDVPSPIDAGNAWAVVVTDWNGDGRPDLIANAGKIIVLENKGDLTFEKVNEDTRIENNSEYLHVADMNGDGREDLIVYGGRGMAIYPAPDANGALGEPFSLELGPLGLRVGDVGDIDGDGSPDLAIASFTGSPLLVIAHGDGRGGFERIEHHNVSEDMEGLQAIVADVDGDGVLDVLVAGHTKTEFGTDDYLNRKPRLALMRGIGGGQLVEDAVLALPSGATAWRIARADLDGDGRPEVVVLAGGYDVPGGNDIPGAYHLLSYGEGGLEVVGPGFIESGTSRPQILLEDLDGDGYRDLVRASGNVAIHWGCDR